MAVRPAATARRTRRKRGKSWRWRRASPATASAAAAATRLLQRRTERTQDFPPSAEDLADENRPQEAEAGEVGVEPDLDERDRGREQEHAFRETTRPGHVLVMDCRGVTSAAAAGEILIARLQARNAAGLVADGGIRDYPAVQALGFPVYALGPAAPAHIARHVAIDENLPVACAEVLVMPGDVLVGDGEGVVCIPRHVVDTVAASALEQDRLEAFLLEKVRRGAPLPGTYPPDAATLAEYEAHKRR